MVESPSHFFLHCHYHIDIQKTFFYELQSFGGNILSESDNEIRGGSRTAATCKLERFVIIVNGFQPLTIITKRSILDVAVVLDPPLEIVEIPHYDSNKFKFQQNCSLLETLKSEKFNG